MFDIGFLEIVIITVVALVVVGPERLPDVARTAGRWVGGIRRFVGNVKADIDKELQQEDLKKALARDAGLDEIKQIMNTDRFTLEDENDDYNKAIEDVDQKAAYQENQQNQQVADEDTEEDTEEDWEFDITSNESGHNDAAEPDDETIDEEAPASKNNDK